MALRIFVDGGSRGNPGPAAAGVVIHDADDQTPLLEAGYFLGKVTNNVAEYHGLIHALDAAAKAVGNEHIQVFSDSLLMVKQINGEYRVKSADLRPLYERAKGLLSGFAKWEMQHVYREKNVRADELANLAMDARRDVVDLAVCGFAATKTNAQSNTKNGNRNKGAVGSTGREAPQLAKPLAWSATLAEDAPATCPAPAKASVCYKFFNCVPPNLCVYLAQSLLAGDAGLYISRRAVHHCVACGVAVRVDCED